MFEFLNPFRKSPLQLAIERGTRPGGNLTEELGSFSDYKISSRRDATAICDALADITHAAIETDNWKSNLDALTRLFQQVEDFESDGFEVLCHEGIPELVRIAESSLARQDVNEDDLLFVLKILAIYGSERGAELIIEAARKPLSPDSYWWTPIFNCIGDGHPHRDFIFRELSDPLPEHFIAMSLLDAANRLMMEGALENHPFNHQLGAARIRHWLTGNDPEQFSYAISATAALPFIDPTWRTELFRIAERHPSDLVQLEAAWAQAKAGEDSGIEKLASLCLDVNLCERAVHYLQELKRADAVPHAASDSDFRAKADFANWLAHPNELGHAPDELEIVDRRNLNWPPERDSKPFWLIRYTIRDKSGLGEDSTDCGVIGSMTFCFFSYKFAERPSEDCYAIHCYWEMEGQKLVEEMDVTNPDEYASMLSQWTGGELESAKVVKVAELSAALQYPQKMVALAEAQQHGLDGWLVLDGPRSAWYPQADFPDSGKFTTLNLHVGRQLLGFTEVVDRKQFLKPQLPQRDPRQIVETYDRLLAESETADDARKAKLLADWKSPLFKHFQRYVEALAKIDEVTQPVALIAAYERFPSAVRSAGEEFTRKAADEVDSPLRVQFMAYVEALIATNRQTDVATLIEYFDPMWEHGQRSPGTAAFRIRKFDVAERYLVEMRQTLMDYCRSEEMSLLAELWTLDGRSSDAQELLIDCLKGLVAMVKESKYPSDQEMFENEFQHHRHTFLRLFPALGQAELSQYGIPATALP